MRKRFFVHNIHLRSTRVHFCASAYSHEAARIATVTLRRLARSNLYFATTHIQTHTTCLPFHYTWIIARSHSVLSLFIMSERSATSQQSRNPPSRGSTIPAPQSQGGTPHVAEDAVPRASLTPNSATGAASNPQSLSQTSKKDQIVVSGLPVDITKADIKEQFETSIGRIKRVTIEVDHKGDSEKIAIIKYARPESAAEAVKKYDGTKIAGRPVWVYLRSELSPEHISITRPPFAFTFEAGGSATDWKVSAKQQKAVERGGGHKNLPIRLSIPGSTLSAAPVELFPKTLPSTDTILKRCVSAIDVCVISDVEQIFQILRRKTLRKLPQRDVGADEQPVTKWSLIISLDHADLSKEHCDSADVAEELHKLFPNLLAIARSPSWDGGCNDILQIRIRCYEEKPLIPRYGVATFEAWLQAVAKDLPVQGLKVETQGDLRAFWGTVRPQQHSKAQQRVAYAFTEIWNLFSTVVSSGILFAATARKHRDLPLAVTAAGVVKLAMLCVACLKLAPLDTAVSTPGNTLCCKKCFAELFEVCHVCTEPTHKDLSVEVVCGHKYCSECLTHCFETATRTVNDFPPRCCDQTLSVYTHRNSLPDAVIKRYLEVTEERESRKDIHCATVTCERPIIKSYIIENDYGMCSTCLQLTCSRCEKLEKDHSLEEDTRKCPRTGDEELLELATANNWKACPKCGTMVSRSEGCNAMRCRCGQGFCYTCGETYQDRRTCSCPMTFEARPNRADGANAARRPMIGNITHILAGVATRLLLQQRRAELGIAEAVTIVQGLRDGLAAQNVQIAENLSLSNWVISLTMQHDGREEAGEHLAGHTRIALTWEPLLPRWADEQLMLDCDHRRMERRFQERCHGCLELQRNVRQCLTCMATLCHDCRPVVDGEF